MYWTNHRDILIANGADLDIPKPSYLGSSLAPYLIGGKPIGWDFYSFPAVYSRAPNHIIGRYGNGASQFLAYPAWLIKNPIFTSPYCFDFVDLSGERSS